MLGFDATLVKGFLCSLFYGVVSISITLFNKMVLSGYQFNYPSVMALFQMSFSMFMLFTMRAIGLAQFAEFDMATAKQVLPLTLSFLGMVLTGLSSLGHLTVPMFDALRRTTTLITLLGQWYFLGQKSGGGVRFSIYIMVAGAGVAALGDLSFDLWGYTLVIVNCALTAAYLIYISKFSKTLNTWALLYYCNLLSWPVVLVVCFASGDLVAAMSYPYSNDTWFLVCFAFQSSLAFLLNYAIFLCTRVNSALATSVTGQVKNIMTTALGYFMFGDVKYHTLNVVGLGIGIGGSAAYSFLKFREAEEQQLERQRNSSEAAAAVPLTAISVTSPTKQQQDNQEDPEDADTKTN